MLEGVVQAHVSGRAQEGLGRRATAGGAGDWPGTVAHQHEAGHPHDREAVEGLRVDLHRDLALADQWLHLGHGLAQRTVGQAAQDD